MQTFLYTVLNKQDINSDIIKGIRNLILRSSQKHTHTHTHTHTHIYIYI